HGCTAAAEEVQLSMRRMVRQMLHEPTVRARQAAANGTLEEYEAALETVFGINVDESSNQRKNGRLKSVVDEFDATSVRQRTA
ncbi:MAG: hypothetical protein L0J69_01920, partial [Yaniella sp.]|nr:hypothetical protein [Yaniella sp.]